MHVQEVGLNVNVYLVKNKFNGKGYVGITTVNIDWRIAGHLKDVEKGSTLPFHLALRKYGIESFDISSLQDCESTDELKLAEVYWIDKLSTFIDNHGYNATRGGDGIFGHKHTLETRKKQSMSARNKIVSSIARSNMSIAQKKRFTSEENLKKHRDILSKIDRSYVNTNAYKAKISAANTGKKRSKITCENISKALLARKYKMSEDKKLKISTKLIGNQCAKRCPILQYDLDGKFIAYHATTYAAASSIGKKSPSAIIACCKGRISFAQGYIWKYATVDEVV